MVKGSLITGLLIQATPAAGVDLAAGLCPAQYTFLGCLVDMITPSVRLFRILRRDDGLF